MAIAEVIRVEAERTVRLEVEDVPEEDVPVNRLALGGQPQDQGRIVADGITGVMGTRRNQEAEAVGKALLLPQVDAGSLGVGVDQDGCVGGAVEAMEDLDAHAASPASSR